MPGAEDMLADGMSGDETPVQRHERIRAERALTQAADMMESNGGPPVDREAIPGIVDSILQAGLSGEEAGKRMSEFVREQSGFRFPFPVDEEADKVTLMADEVPIAEYVLPGRCCDNGHFGEPHDCQKKDGQSEYPDPEQDYWLEVTVVVPGYGKRKAQEDTLLRVEREMKLRFGEGAHVLNWRGDRRHG